MPFIPRQRRESPDPLIPGELCYLYYKSFVDKWNNNRRWTTAHIIFRDEVVKPLMLNPSKQGIMLDDVSARLLAWQVFFIKKVMPYEDEKERENGSI